MSDNKFRYLIFPDRTYTIEVEGEQVEIEGQDIVNIVPEMLLKKYVQACFGYEAIPFDKTQESLVE
jgi:RNase P/RNase MRP subunit p29